MSTICRGVGEGDREERTGGRLRRDRRKGGVKGGVLELRDGVNGTVNGEW